MFDLTYEEIKLIITLYMMQYEKGDEPQGNNGYDCIEKLKELGYIHYAETSIRRAGYPLEIIYIRWKGVKLEEKGRKVIEMANEVAGDINSIEVDHLKAINLLLRKYDQEVKGLANINIGNVEQFNQNNGLGTIMGNVIKNN